eukprot:1837543-Prymnesium_polylepis.1
MEQASEVAMGLKGDIIAVRQRANQEFKGLRSKVNRVIAQLAQRMAAVDAQLENQVVDGKRKVRGVALSDSDAAASDTQGEADKHEDEIAMARELMGTLARATQDMLEKEARLAAAKDTQIEEVTQAAQALSVRLARAERMATDGRAHVQLLVDELRRCDDERAAQHVQLTDSRTLARSLKAALDAAEARGERLQEQLCVLIKKKGLTDTSLNQAQRLSERVTEERDEARQQRDAAARDVKSLKGELKAATATLLEEKDGRALAQRQLDAISAKRDEAMNERQREALRADGLQNEIDTALRKLHEATGELKESRSERRHRCCATSQQSRSVTCRALSHNARTLARVPRSLIRFLLLAQRPERAARLAHRGRARAGGARARRHHRDALSRAARPGGDAAPRGRCLERAGAPWLRFEPCGLCARRTSAGEHERHFRLIPASSGAVDPAIFAVDSAVCIPAVAAGAGHDDPHRGERVGGQGAEASVALRHRAGRSAG